MVLNVVSFHTEIKFGHKSILAVGLDFVLGFVHVWWHVVLDVGTVGDLVILRRQIDGPVWIIKCNVRFSSVILKGACSAIGASGSVVIRLGQSCRVSRRGEWSPSRNRRHRRVFRADGTVGLCGLGRGGGRALGRRSCSGRATRARVASAARRGDVLGDYRGRSRARVEVIDGDGRVEFGGKFGRDETIVIELAVVVFVFVVKVFRLLRLRVRNVALTIDWYHVLLGLPQLLIVLYVFFKIIQ